MAQRRRTAGRETSTLWRRARVWTAVGASGCAATLGVAAAGPARAAATAQTQNVSCSAAALTAAVAAADAAGGGTIALAGGCTYSLTAVAESVDGPTGLPRITGDVTVDGNGATIVRGAGAPSFRFFDVAPGARLTLTSVTLSGGSDGSGIGGGAVFNDGTLSMSGVDVADDTAPETMGASGGGVINAGTLTVTGSTFTGDSGWEAGAILNEAQATVSTSTFDGNDGTVYGGGAVVGAAGTTTLDRDTFVDNTTGSGGGGGAIDNDSTVNVDNSTFTGNTGGTNGGGAIQNFGTMAISYATLDGDSSPYGAEIHNLPASGDTLTVTDSVVANGEQGNNCSGSAAVTDGGYNIDSGSSCGFSAAGHSRSDTDPQLGSLADNGGPTETMALAADSPAVNAIPSTEPGCLDTTDQRGVPRPQGPGCDVGAYELRYSPIGGLLGGVIGGLGGVLGGLGL